MAEVAVPRESTALQGGRGGHHPGSSGRGRPSESLSQRHKAPQPPSSALSMAIPKGQHLQARARAGSLRAARTGKSHLPRDSGPRGGDQAVP